MFAARQAQLIWVLVALGACVEPGAETGEKPADADGDGFPVGEDCNDSLDWVHPGAPELCDGVDSDCDGARDEGVTLPFYPDADGDGYGGEGLAVVLACTAPSGYAEGQTDCADDDPAVHPGATEACNNIDDDCDGVTDGEQTLWYVDADGDGYGDPATGVETCTPAAGQVVDGSDCDDGDPTVHPSAEEVCDLDDDDCDGRADSGSVGTWYSDDDGDGYGNPYEKADTCAPEVGWVQQAGDCRPSEPSGFPGAAELCNGTDDDCDGAVDEDFDLDGDGDPVPECDGLDCDDADSTVSTLAHEVCEDGIDNNCDGRDSHCTFDGTHGLADADAKLTAPAAYDAGRLFAFDDLDGDGAMDIVAATLYADGYRGGAYVVSGADVSGNATLEALGHHLQPNRSTYAGRSVGAGDLDGDGVGDVAVGAPDGTEKEWVVFGPLTGDVDLDSADVTFSGTYGSETGHGSFVAELSGDGQDDLVIGAYEDATASYAAGATYVQYGPLTAGEYDVTDTYDAALYGESPSAYAGRYVRAGADVDGDGIGDIMLAAPYANHGAPGSGGVYVVHGGVTGDLDLASADCLFSGESASDYAGEDLAFGDVDGDGLADAIIGSYGNAGGAYAGAAHVVFAPFGSTESLASADATLRGSYGGHYFGLGLAVGDTDGDGAGELLVGATGDSAAGAGSGAAYLFFGPLSGSVTVSDAAAIYQGESAGDAVGEGLGIADIDGDGRGDLVIGATGEASGGSGAGAVYIVFGM